MVILVLLFILCLIIACGFGLYKSRKKSASIPVDPNVGILTDSATLGQLAAMRGQQQFQNYQNMNPPQHFMSTPSGLVLVNDPVEQFSSPAQILPSCQSPRTRTGNVSFDPRTVVYGPNGMTRGGVRFTANPPAVVPPQAVAVVVPHEQYIGPHADMDRGVMGSTEAEFQNDFIDVFPNRHLEPKPDLQ